MRERYQFLHLWLSHDTQFSGNERHSPCWEFLESDWSFWFRKALCRFNGSVIKGRQQKWMDWRVNKCNEPKCSNWSVLWKPHAKITTINSYRPQSLVHCKFMLHTQNLNHSICDMWSLLGEYYYQQGCINCAILPSGMGARGVSSEHVENMEMFSCSPT